MDLDAQLIQGVAKGNEADFEKLFHRYQSRLAAFFLQRTHDPHTAEELLQETMMVVWQKAASFNHRSLPSTWIIGIGYRKFLEWHRANAKSHERLQTEAERNHEELPSQGDDVSKRLEREAVVDQIKQAIAELTEEHRVVLDLTFQQGLSYAEIARILESKPGTIKSRMFYAKQRLKEILVRRGMKGDELWKISKGM
jgi:RNA polymerase sigma-70 factor (ECF subfamily)